MRCSDGHPVLEGATAKLLPVFYNSGCSWSLSDDTVAKRQTIS